jgi:prepilin-type N-terminal cleavage/methylation domain-containing protein
VKETFYHQRAFTLLEILITLALIATLSGIGVRLLGHESTFKASVKTFHAYLQSVSDYAIIHENCYLLVGSSSHGDEPLREFVLMELDPARGPVFLREHFFRLGPGEFLVPPGAAAAGSNFQAAPLPDGIQNHWTAIALGKGIGPIQFVLAFQSARRTSFAILRIQENGTVTLQ